MSRPALRVLTKRMLEGGTILVRGSGWPGEELRIRVDRRPPRFLRVLAGEETAGGIHPDPAGEILFKFSTLGLARGRHALSVTSRRRSVGTLRGTFLVQPRRQVKDKRLRDKPFLRALDFFERRFGRLDRMPSDARLRQVGDIRRLRGVRDGTEISAVNPNVCNWHPLGPGPTASGQTEGVAQPTSGRAKCIAVHPSTPSTVYVGTAGGGIWKSVDGGRTWAPKTDFNASLAIGCLAMDPHNASRLFAGTGEYQYGSAGDYFGVGLLYSDAAGEKPWKELGAEYFAGAAITRIVFDPTDTKSQRMYLSASNGVWRSENGGVAWTLMRAGVATDLVFSFMTQGPKNRMLVAGFAEEGIFTSIYDGAAWSAVQKVPSAELPQHFGRIALAQCASQPKVVYAVLTQGVDGIAGVALSNTGGAFWQFYPPPKTDGFQAGFHLVLAVHPTIPELVYLGEKRLWLRWPPSINEASTLWTEVTGGGLHADQHGIGFDPINGKVIWCCNDGGVFRSEDRGYTWTHRNSGLATIQYNRVAQHPVYETILLAGAQDNGTHRYSGNPAALWSASGDGGISAIDPSLPTRMYRGAHDWDVERSDAAGEVGTWMPKDDGLQADPYTLFYPPFALDESAPGVCYFGGSNLWRSGDHADTWGVISWQIFGLITAIAVDPTDTTSVVIGTNTGRVYRVDHTGPGSGPKDYTTTELTGPHLPPKTSISSIAIDTGGNIWVGIGSMADPAGPGQLTADHVFRLGQGSTVWTARSSGLSKANPVNTIVIDPADEQRLFCGADVGVFRTEDGGKSWTLWDEGLPNAPVFHLAIHQPSRLLRAATYGRSIWERPIDAAKCSLVDICIRDNIVDSGRVQPSPSGVPHPFAPNVLLDWSHSPDIVIDRGGMGPKSKYQTDQPVQDYVELEAKVVHGDPWAGGTCRVYVQVHNRGAQVALGVKVRAFVTATTPAPLLPKFFWFDANPPGTDWIALGPAKTVSVPPAVPAVVAWDWPIPLGHHGEHTVLAIATCDADPIGSLTPLNLETWVRGEKRAAVRTVYVTPKVPQKKTRYIAGPVPVKHPSYKTTRKKTAKKSAKKKRSK